MLRGLALASALVASANAQMATCQASFPQVGASYDLTALSNQGGIKIVDSRDNGADPHQYYFSVCNDMTPPKVLNDQNQVVDCTTTLSNGVPVTGPGPAFQTCYTTQSCGTTCHRLGDHAANGVFGLMHSPAFGVSLNYVNGDNCSLSGVTLPRSISLDFICTATAGFITGQDLVLEQLSCAYNAFFHSRAGCPLQCPFLNNKLCAGNGVCDMDWSLNAPRCFCDVGFSGSDCTTPGDKGLPPPPSYGGNIAGGFFGGMFATVGLLVIYVAYLAHSKKETFKDAFKGIFGGGAGGATGGYAPAPSNYAAQPAFTGSTIGGYAPPASDREGPLLA